MNRPLPATLRPRPCSRAQARGFSLIVSLILLVVITLAALAGTRTVAMESRMSATAYDRSLALQSADTALREGEAMARAAVPADFPAAGCINGLCAQPLPTDPGRWVDPAFNSWQAATAAVSDNATAPELIVEANGLGERWLGCARVSAPEPNCLVPRYRVTSRSTAAGRASVIVQSDVAAD
jgi:type IV pilus assembly protein PilX